MRWSVHDREILRLALPALGALAAEPLYLLADTAIVGHIGTRQLAALALAATVLSSLAALCNFLTYGTTAQIARLHGAGQRERSDELGIQALWAALAVGLLAALLTIAGGPIVVRLLGGDGHVGDLAVRYLRLSAAGLRVRLQVSGNEALTPAIFSPVATTAVGTGNTLTLSVQGLQPDTDYYYGIEVAGALRAEPI